MNIKNQNYAPTYLALANSSFHLNLQRNGNANKSLRVIIYVFYIRNHVVEIVACYDGAFIFKLQLILWSCQHKFLSQSYFHYFLQT